MAAPGARFQFAIDRGGTFTDVIGARALGGRVRVLKLLSEDPANYRDAPTEGIRRILQEECGTPFPKDQPLDTSHVEWIRMGTTVATNALLERKGERLALLITKGFRDLLYVGTQARPKIFDLAVSVPEVLYEAVVEVDERVVLHQEGCQLFGDGQPIKSVTGVTSLGGAAALCGFPGCPKGAGLPSRLFAKGSLLPDQHLWRILPEQSLLEAGNGAQRWHHHFRHKPGIRECQEVVPAREEQSGACSCIANLAGEGGGGCLCGRSYYSNQGWCTTGPVLILRSVCPGDGSGERHVRNPAEGGSAAKPPGRPMSLTAEASGGLAGLGGSAVPDRWPNHEQQVGALARDLGFRQVSLSSEVMPMVRAVPRGYTACADAYLTPCISRYLEGFRAGFASQLQGVPVLFMRSDGGLTPMDAFSGSRAIVSGPAGGVVGYAVTTYRQEGGLPVIGFDMGGTSTDVSRYAGEYEHVFEATTAGISIQAPQLDINTVAAGGGSQLFFRSGLFVVGPESAGAHPGPSCYRKGGPLTVTDANLCLGRLLPEYFPCIFGPHEDQPLSQDAPLQAFRKLTADINAFLGPWSALSVEEVALGFIRVANEAMCRPIRALTQARGHDTARHVLACFGGAGGQHACAVARILGMRRVFIHKYSGILSAYGLALANVVHEAQEPCALVYAPEAFARLDERVAALEEECVQALVAQGFRRAQISTEAFLHMRYERTDCALMCSAKGHPATPASCHSGDFRASFATRYLQEFGFTIPSRAVLVDDIRVRGTATSGLGQEEPVPASKAAARVEKVTRCYFEGGYQDTCIYLLEDLSWGHCVPGPSILIDQNSTILVEPASCNGRL
ncbi:5-oxoprolinase [Sphaerodactylus townsendi]|uniref:5-oxoprolinase n=1 Tax=Sphaerodactylus townsendi TaxID=933632 RepID=UPI002025BBD2|nr:5-oxoprolinase [Sphaerodactylus townsendi]